MYKVRLNRVVATKSDVVARAWRNRGRGSAEGFLVSTELKDCPNPSGVPTQFDFSSLLMDATQEATYEVSPCYACAKYGRYLTVAMMASRYKLGVAGVCKGCRRLCIGGPQWHHYGLRTDWLRQNLHHVRCSLWTCNLPASTAKQMQCASCNNCQVSWKCESRLLLNGPRDGQDACVQVLKAGFRHLGNGASCQEPFHRWDTGTPPYHISLS